MFSDIETPLLFLWCSHGPILHSDQDLFHSTVFCWPSNFFSSWKDSSKVIKLPQTVVVVLITLLFSTRLIVSLSVVMSVFNCFINHDPTITAANKVVCK